MELKDDSHCFVCGKDNPQGLKLNWLTEGNTSRAQFSLSKTHQGWKGIVHGGILATILDEGMTRLAWQIHGGAVTAEMTVRYHSPALVDEPLTVTSTLGDSQNRLIQAQAEIRNESGRLVASSTGKILKAKY